MSTFRKILSADDVTEEILKAAEITEEWFQDEDRIDWEDFLERLDGTPLADGTLIDLGPSTDSPAIRKIKKHVRELRSS